MHAASPWLPRRAARSDLNKMFHAFQMTERIVVADLKGQTPPRCDCGEPCIVFCINPSPRVNSLLAICAESKCEYSKWFV